MKRTRILLLTTDGAGELALSLKRVMEDGGLCDFDLTEELLPDERLTNHTRNSPLAHGHPNIVVICLAQGGLMRGKAVIGVVWKHLLEVPILVATDMDEPKKLWQLLAVGAADFITPPFRSSDLLPRFWRLHPGAIPMSLSSRKGLA